MSARVAILDYGSGNIRSAQRAVARQGVETVVAGLPDDARFYFVHSYAAQKWELTDTAPMAAPKVAWCDYGARPFVAAVENGALWAAQFHPEKSGDAGAALLANWIATL